MNSKKYFNIGNLIFWILLLFLFLVFIPFFGDFFFNEKLVKEWEKELKTEDRQDEEWDDTEYEDTSTVNGKINIVWKWQDYDLEWHQISFSVDSVQLNQVPGFREDQGNILNVLYGKLHDNSLPIMDPMIEAFKAEIKKQNYPKQEAYMKSMELVASAVQFIPYTLVLDDQEECPCEMPFGSFSADCKVQSDGRGCCSGIMPLGVYAPAEFMYHKKGDCDTRSLFAYTILNELGFDVAVMVSQEEGHSVLGVHLKNRNCPSYGRDASGKKYFLWELTARGFQLGYDVKGNDWESYLN
jgi:hypothetical protein